MTWPQITNVTCRFYMKTSRSKTFFLAEVDESVSLPFGLQEQSEVGGRTAHSPFRVD